MPSSGRPPRMPAPLQSARSRASDGARAARWRTHGRRGGRMPGQNREFHRSAPQHSGPWPGNDSPPGAARSGAQGGQVDRRGQRAQRLVGADVGGCFFAADMLFPGLEGEDKGSPSLALSTVSPTMRPGSLRISCAGAGDESPGRARRRPWEGPGAGPRRTAISAPHSPAECEKRGGGRVHAQNAFGARLRGRLRRPLLRPR